MSKVKSLFATAAVLSVLILAAKILIEEKWASSATIAGLAVIFVLGAILIMLIYIKEAWVYFNSRGKRALKYLYLAAVMLPIAVFISTAGMIYLNSYADPISPPAPKYLIILGGGFHKDKINTTLETRLKTGIAYMEAHPEVVAVVSGAVPAGCTIPESRAMYNYISDYYKAKAKPMPRVLVEGRATNTFENFIYSKELIKDIMGDNLTEAAFVTNPFHICRSRMLAGRAGIKGYGIPAEQPFLIESTEYFYEIPAFYKSFFFDEFLSH